MPTSRIWDDSFKSTGPLEIAYLVNGKRAGQGPLHHARRKAF